MAITSQERKVFKWIGYSTLCIVLLLLTSLTILSFTYDRTVIKYLKKYLDEHLLTEIIVGDIDFSMIKKFPFATVEFSQVVIKSKGDLNFTGFKTGDKDTLMWASKIYFQFGLIGLIKNEYQLKKIQLVDGKINILIDKTGRNNYSIWKSIEKEKSKEDYRIELQNVIISSFDFQFTNLKNNLVIHSFIKKSVFNGSISKNTGLYSLKSIIQLWEAQEKGKVYFKNIPVFIDFKATSQDDKLSISPSKIIINKLPIQFQGTILLDHSQHADLTITSSQFGLDEIFSLIPAQQNRPICDYIYEGKGKFNSRIKGPFFSGGFPQIKINFALTNGSVTNKKTKSKLTHVDIIGVFAGDKPSNYRLDISKIEARLSTGKIHGKCSISNMQKPDFIAELYSTINLNNLQHLIEYDTIESMDGTMHANLKLKGTLSKKEDFTLSNVFSKLQSGSFELDDCSIKLKGLNYIFQDINGKTHIDNNISFQDFALTINQTNFVVTGTIDNMIEYLNDNKSIIIANLYLYSKVIDGNSFVKEQQGSANDTAVNFPDHIKIKATINADELRIGKFNATNLKCELNYDKNELNINKFNFKFIDGTISGNSLINRQGDSCIIVNCISDLNRIDIQQLFIAFNNFGQDFILDENLRGMLGGNVAFTGCWNNQLKFVPSSLVAQADFEIINGELLKFDPMLSLSKYIDVDELKHIKFKTLKNTIYIYDQKIRIPEMLIHTSAFNISLSGTHSFSYEFDYRLRVALSDVLFKKAKHKKKEIDDYLIMENDAEKTVIPISIIGTPDNYKVEFDSKRAFDLIKENIQQQSAELKELFGGEKILPSEQGKKNNNQTIIEWEIDDNAQSQQKETKIDHSDDEIRIKWEEEDSSDINYFN